LKSTYNKDRRRSLRIPNRKTTAKKWENVSKKKADNKKRTVGKRNSTAKRAGKNIHRWGREKEKQGKKRSPMTWYQKKEKKGKSWRCKRPKAHQKEMDTTAAYANKLPQPKLNPESSKKQKPSKKKCPGSATRDNKNIPKNSK